MPDEARLRQQTRAAIQSGKSDRTNIEGWHLVMRSSYVQRWRCGRPGYGAVLTPNIRGGE
jgi:hypothetical protein